MHCLSVADGQNLATRRVLGRWTERFGPGWPGAAAGVGRCCATDAVSRL